MSRAPGPPVLLERGFRPFFLLAALQAVLALAAWMALLRGVALPDGLLGPRDWHVHEMLFGYLPAVMAGFLLTAVPNWTERAPVRGAALAALVALWLVSRGAHFLTALDPRLAAALTVAFPAVLAALVWREVVASRRWRQLPVCVLVTLVAVADAGFLAVRIGAGDADGTFERLGLACAAMLVALIGGRVTPAFTRNWMKARALSPLPAEFGTVDRVALAALALAMCAWVWVPAGAVTATAFGLASAATVARLARWRGPATFAEPLVTVLHVGYAWLAVWLALAALAAAGRLPASAAVHALTAGTIGTMTLAIMTRASLGHAGRALHAGPATVVAYLLVIAGASVRVAAQHLPVDYLLALEIAASLWGGAFALFLLAYGPLLLGLARRERAAQEQE